jgi:hypothetical protein
MKSSKLATLLIIEKMPRIPELLRLTSGVIPHFKRMARPARGRDEMSERALAYCRLLPTREASAAERKSSMSPSSTAWTLLVSTPVRRSFTI